MDMDGRWDLAPAYDLCHTYNPSSPWVSHQALSVNGKRNGITRDDFMAVARQMNIRNAKNIIDHINDTVQNWSRHASQAGVDGRLEAAVKKTLKGI